MVGVPASDRDTALRAAAIVTIPRHGDNPAQTWKLSVIEQSKSRRFRLACRVVCKLPWDEGAPVRP
eukprot:13640722-Alexandrium_andersonii.AAC.1